MSARAKILVGMALGVLWSGAVIWAGTQLDIPPFSRVFVEPVFFLAPGVVLLMMITSLAIRRFFNDALIDGDDPALGSAAEIDQRVLRNTVEQALLAVCLWMPISYLLPVDGLGVVMALSVNFALMRIVFWVGYQISPPLRAFGFAATFYPTIAAIVWAGLWWATT